MPQEVTMFLRTIAVATACLALGAASASAGEITGNGKPLWTNTDQWGVPHTLHGASACAFSGQEDLQFDPSNTAPVGHSQSWGQIPKADRDGLPAFLHPGIACNPQRSAGIPG